MSLDKPHRPIRIIKASERLAAQNSSVQMQIRDTISLNERRELDLELRRLMIRAVNYIEKVYGLRDTELNSE